MACDLGRVTAADGAMGWFTTVAHTGFDAEANRWANTVSWASGTTVYVLATLRTLATYRPVPLRVVVDGVTHDSAAWLVAVANSRYYAGGMMIAPGAEIDDGLLDVCVVGAVPRLELLARFPRVFRGTHATLDAVKTWRGTHGAARRRRRRLDVGVLGEWGAGRAAAGDARRRAGGAAGPGPGSGAGYWAMIVACMPAARWPGMVQYTT